MEWSKLLNIGRLGDPDYTEQPNRPIYVQDADRIVFSAPFRRLANKTQVHPLYDHDHIHHRLIHSVETGSVGRSLGMAIGHWMEEAGHIQVGEKHAVAGMVQAACLAHDIGNPPFGHSGEAAIGQWFKERFANSSSVFGAMDHTLRGEFENFEGNAQGFRVISKTEMYRNSGGMRLSMGVLGTFTKYPTTQHVKVAEKIDYCGVKKFGVFQSDLDTFKKVAASVGLPEESNANGTWWRRHPLVFLVEAADDICYNILDLEDAYTSGDLSYEVIETHLSPLAGSSNNDLSGWINEEKIAYMRARGIGAAVTACVEAFKDNYDAIMDGTFSSSLIEVSSKKDIFFKIKELSKQRIFKARRKIELEVSGRNVVHRVLDGIFPVYQELMTVDWKTERLSGYNQQLLRAVNLDLRDVDGPYVSLHSLADFVSGMTDRYAVKIAKMLSGN